MRDVNMSIPRVLLDGATSAAVALASGWQHSAVKHCFIEAAENLRNKVGSLAGKQGFTCIRDAVKLGGPIESITLLSGGVSLGLSSLHASWVNFVDGYFFNSALYFGAGATLLHTSYKHLVPSVDGQNVPMNDQQVQVLQTIAFSILAQYCLQKGVKELWGNRLNAAGYLAVTTIFFYTLATQSPLNPMNISE